MTSTELDSNPGALEVPAAAAPEAKSPETPGRFFNELISPASRIIDFSAIIIPFLVFIGAAIYFWGRGLNLTQLGVMIGMYLFTGFGVTVGFHRLFTHKSFETPRWVRLTLAVLGSMSVQGPLLWWVALHRRHHHHSDSEGDPHSPHLHDGNFFGAIAGAWHSHVGWLFKPDPADVSRYVPDLVKDKTIAAISKAYPFWAAFGLFLPALLGGLLTRSYSGALCGLLWGGLARVFMVHHITWSVNSVCHIWGSQPFESHDNSRNNVVVGLLALGEGWHNNHHAFPTSARHGLFWWQPDSSYWVIQAMAALGLASRVRVPAESVMEAKRAR